jgi:hypothetical protein
MLQWSAGGWRFSSWQLEICLPVWRDRFKANSFVLGIIQHSCTIQWLAFIADSDEFMLWKKSSNFKISSSICCDEAASYSSCLYADNTIISISNQAKLVGRAESMSG